MITNYYSAGCLWQTPSLKTQLHTYSICTIRIKFFFYNYRYNIYIQLIQYLLYSSWFGSEERSMSFDWFNSRNHGNYYILTEVARGNGSSLGSSSKKKSALKLNALAYSKICQWAILESAVPRTRRVIKTTYEIK